MIYIIILVLAIFVLHKINDKIKNVKLSSLVLITGAVKSGKTTYAVATAYGEYKKAKRIWKIKTAIGKLFGKEPTEEPLLYSNIPLATDYVPITKDIIERKKRPNYKSVLFIDEATLLADNSIYEDKELSERIMIFNKLIGHETRGGTLIYDTQATGDLPAVTRRCITQRLYVHSLIKWIPFILIARVREERYSEDGSTIQVDQKDISEQGYKIVVFRKKIWKLFDPYCYSAITDNLPKENKVVNGKNLKSLKTRNILSYKDYKSLKETAKNEQKSKVNNSNSNNISTTNNNFFNNGSK